MEVSFATPATPVAGTLSGVELMRHGLHRYGFLVVAGAYALCYVSIKTTGD